MTVRRIRDLRRLLEAEAQPFGADVRLERTRGDHLRAVFSQGVNKLFLIIAATPSDRRVHRQVRSGARRVLRDLTTYQDGQTVYENVLSTEEAHK
jgi:hypothetical protein